jgi:hypothetical protein
VNWWIAICAAVVAVVVVAGANRARTPAHQTMAEGNCAGCHADTPPADHTAAFIDGEHGPISRGQAAQCIACHSDRHADCDECHANEQPEWHTKPMRQPWRTLSARDEHAAEARKRRELCGGCHIARFQRQCANCHRRDESWTGIVPGGLR